MDKHFFTTDVIDRGLRGVVAASPTLRLIPSLRVVYNPEHLSDQVSIISGGGGGHEPFPSGFVGDGLLAASVSGDIFASPSARQVLGAIKAVPSSKGTILLITNYTGDCLHFNLAQSQARAAGLNVASIKITDDVSVGRSTGALVGRRALAGTPFIAKLLGAASRDTSISFDTLVQLGQTCTDSLASIAATLNRSHVPGRGEKEDLPSDVVEIGMGVHNEPGFFTVSPIPNAHDLISRMLALILDESDKDRNFVSFSKSDDIILIVSNMGGLSVLELNATLDEVHSQLHAQGFKVAVRVYSGTYVTTLNAPGVCVSLMNLTQAASQSGFSTEKLLELLDASQSSLAWVKAADSVPSRSGDSKELEVEVDSAEHAVEEETDGARVPVELLSSVLFSAAATLRDAEPELTKWDTIVGDGDCGETCFAGAEAVIQHLDSLVSSGNIVSTLRKLTDLVDDTCGGTLGAIFSIFLASLTYELRSLPASTSLTVAEWGPVAARALAALQQATPARIGHRTMMDSLSPFVDTLANTLDLSKAVEACRAGADSTIPMTAKLGRATYVGTGRGVLPPDPGSKAVEFIVVGMEKALREAGIV